MNSLPKYPEIIMNDDMNVAEFEGKSKTIQQIMQQPGNIENLVKMYLNCYQKK